ncbi:MAG TPA: hypothetical protein EYN07_08500 [Flavobacteriaceae bacterium]|jgi:hypothetical protein|nr:hypothetical protein [Flavobacteriaceae bacterium]MAY52740.1 hypothetical protein [Flavobacteriaceae bacterium]HIB47107.1 hypothetical protein [Flavobacteriaceae bacterium]HIN99263.1 hypothetical protein [Flavobacteriaceae bacterium]|tara:strand:- start:69 stop:644 length:576 start_codon:yes stop_codon:yes gene_type:complete
MNRFARILEKNLSGKKVLGLFILTNLVYLFMLLVTIPKTMGFANGMKLLDMLPMGYSHDYANKLFNTLGEDGREIYLTNQIPVDMIYPLLFGLTYSLLLAYFLKKLNKLKSPLTYLSLLPIIAGIADYLENIGIITMLKSYPDLAETTVIVTNTFSVIKSTTTSIFFIVLAVILVVLGIRSVKKKSNLGRI